MEKSDTLKTEDVQRSSLFVKNPYKPLKKDPEIKRMNFNGELSQENGQLWSDR